MISEDYKWGDWWVSFLRADWCGWICRRCWRAGSVARRAVRVGPCGPSKGTLAAAQTTANRTKIASPILSERLEIENRTTESLAAGAARASGHLHKSSGWKRLRSSHLRRRCLPDGNAA